MPTMRSFTGFASTPDLGGSFIGGANSMTALIQAGNQLKLGREKIQADMAQASMEMQVKQQALQSQALRDEQELRVKDQYQQSILGMKQRELDQAQEMVNLKTQEAAQQFQAQQGFEKSMADLTAGGMDINEAFKRSALNFGPQMGMPGSAYSGLMPDEAAGGAGGQPGADFGALQSVEGPDGAPIEGYAWGQTGPRSRQLIPLPSTMQEDNTVKPIEGMPGFVERGKKVYRVDDPQELKDLRKKRDKLETEHDKDDNGAKAAKTPEKELKGYQKKYKADWEAREKRLNALEEQIKSFSKKAAASAPAPRLEDYEGKPVRSKRTGELGRVIDGEFVPDEEE